MGIHQGIGSIHQLSQGGLADYYQHQALEKQWAAVQQLGQGTRMYSGLKPLIVCNGVVVGEAKDMDEAQRLAEEHAHKSSANAYILKPIKMVAPKRDVVTTDIP